MNMSSKAGFLRASAAPCVMALALISAPAWAQTANSADETAAAAGQANTPTPNDTIVVTGSRIASPTITSVSPVQVVSAQQIQQSGVTNIQDLLLENPAFGVPALSRTNSAFLTSGTGVATVDLRDLGSDRTLVLINGRRVVAGVPGSATVDLNVIPTQFVQRIDVLTGGASSLYGSDAVAGVVNFIYKDNFQGIEANAQYNITEKGDTPEYQANLTMGGNFADDRGNIMVHVGYTNQGGLLSRERNDTRIDDLDTFANITGDPADFGVPAEGRFSGLPLQGVFTSGGCQFTYNAAGQLQRGFSQNGGAITNAQATACGVPRGTVLEAGGFNRQYFRTISVPVQRYLFASRAKYDLADSLTVFAEGTYNRTSAAREIEPFGVSTAGSTGIFPSNGLYPIETLVGGVRVLNPYVPAAVAAAAVDGDRDGLRDIAFSRRLGEFGSRRSTTNRDFYRFVVGAEGSFLDDKFHYDLSYNYGRTAESQEGNGQVNINNFRNALAAIPSPTGPICADANARANGCVPVNVFGAGSISPAAVAYIQADQTFQTRIQQQVVQGNVSGTILDLPAGPLGVAFGVEYRKENSSENNDSLTNQGLNGGNALPDTRGAFDVKEAYGEINVPLLSDVPFFQALSVRAAGRISDYSTVGMVYSYSGGVEWSPIRDLRFTGTYARAVRAPNIGELFTGPSQTFPAGLQDPCRGVTATATGTLATTCRAFAGVNSNIAANGGAFAVTQSDIQGISGFNLGNPNLREEKSDSYTIGAILNPVSIDALRNLVVRVDYYNISID
ncbi:MAG: cirA, partial [Sphingomonas bacterium]